MAWTFVWYLPYPKVLLPLQLLIVCVQCSPTEIIAFSDAAKQFAERNAEIVFASVDSEYSLLSWASTARKDGGLGSVEIPLFSDKNHKLSRDYGVLLEDEGVALRGLFLIDPKGTVRQVGCCFFPHSLLMEEGGPLLMRGSRLRSMICLSVDRLMRLCDWLMRSSLLRRFVPGLFVLSNQS